MDRSGERASLVAKAAAAGFVERAPAEDLDRHVAIEPLVAGEGHDAHAARADSLGDSVAAHGAAEHRNRLARPPA